MKKIKILLILAFFSLTTILSAQGKKTIYITLDISRSMKGVKYEYANYAVQLLKVLNKKNKVVFIVGKNINDESYTDIQKSDRKFKSEGTQIMDIDKFNEIFDPEIENQELFIIGDGVWGTSRYKQLTETFENKVKSGNVRVTFLEILVDTTETTDFEIFLRDNELGKIYKSDNAESLIKAINTIVEEVSGIKSLSNDEYTAKDSCVVYTPAFNIKKMLILYQDKTGLQEIPGVVSFKIDGVDVEFSFEGEPSTESFQSAGGLVSSKIYRLNQEIGAGKTIKICFDKPVNKDKLRIFPLIDISFNGITIVTPNSTDKKVDINTNYVCRDDTSADIVVEVGQNGKKLNKDAIKNIKINIISNDKKYEAHYDEKKDKFVARIPLDSDTTYYRIESVVMYKRINTGMKKIIKTSDCERKIKELEKKILPSREMYVDLFSNDKECNMILPIVIKDSMTEKSLDPQYFTIKVDNNYKYIFKKVEVRFTKGDTINLVLSKRGFWCSCFVPDKVKFHIIATPKQAINGKQYKELDVPLIINIDKTGRSWYVRCSWLLFSLFGSLLLFWYFVKLSRKKRFRRLSKIVLSMPSIASRHSLNPNYIDSGFYLREKGFFAWFVRWFIPVSPEKRILTFNSAGNHSFHFSATRSFRKIQFLKSDFDKSVMRYNNYDEDSKNKKVNFDENDPITLKITRLGLGERAYYLRYEYPRKSWNDIVWFRIFTGIVIFGLIVTVIFSIALIFTSLT